MYNAQSSFNISSENIIPEGRRRSIGIVFPGKGASPQKEACSTEERSGVGRSQELPETIMDDDKVLVILGELAGLKEQLDDCIDTDVNQFKAIEYLDELKKEIKTLKAEMQKCVSKLEYLNKEPEKVAEYKLLIEAGKTHIKAVDERRESIREEQNKNNDEETFSRVHVLKSSLELTFKRCDVKLSVDLKKSQDGELIMLSDNISNVREEVNDLSKTYLEFVEKCPVNFPERDEVFQTFKKMMTEIEEMRTNYEVSVMKEMQDRELTRNKIQDTKNEIKLAVFKGYDSDLDYYCFKSQFMNKYRSFISRDMVYILKNTYLKGEAFNTVKEMKTLEEIWTRLCDEFGNPSRTLKKKLTEVLAINPSPRTRKVSEKSEAVLKVINLLSDLFKLAEDHELQLELYCKNEKVLGQMLKQMPRLWLHDWHAMKKSHKEDQAGKVKNAPAWMEDKLTWELYKKFLGEQLENLKEEELMEDALKDVAIEDKSKKDNTSKTFTASKIMSGDVEEDDYYSYEEFGDQKPCHVMDTQSSCKLCNAKGHKHYWDCQSFMKKKHAERFELFLNPKKNQNPKPHIGILLGECAACLVPGSKIGHNCHDREEVRKWLCPEQHQRPLNILCCKHHTDKNKNLWEQFQFNTRIGFAQDEVIPEWKRKMEWKVHFATPATQTTTVDTAVDQDAFTVELPPEAEGPIEEPVKDEGLFLFQRILVNGKLYNAFFDNGCGRFCLSKWAVDRMGNRAKQVRKGPIPIRGVADTLSESKYGEFEVRLPLRNGNQALFTGLCFDDVTAEFCEYNVKPLYDKLVLDYVKKGGDKKDMPTLSQSGVCGGETHLMIGVKYNRYQPKKIHELESGLALYESAFVGEDGSYVIIGGPDPLVDQIEREWYQRNQGFTGKDMKSYFSQLLRLYSDGWEIAPDRAIKLISNQQMQHCYSCKSYTKFIESEEAGTQMNYRCEKCRICKDCKCGPVVGEISRKDVYGQQLINENVRFDPNEGKVRCKLPLLQDPAKVLGNNEKSAKKIYHRWVAKLNKNTEDRDSVIRSHDKLKTRGHVAMLKELTEHQIKMIQGSPYKYILPWRPVHNEGSISTPCRITFDASDKTNTGTSLNDLLPRGINQINCLITVFMAWRNGQYAMAGDFEQMYNGVLLDEDSWCLQLYYWHPTLTEGVEPQLGVVKTCIYGVRSSGNQAITGVRLVAEHSKDEFPEAYKVLTDEIYVDDVLPSGKETLEECYQIADQLVVVASRGNLKLKNFAFSTIPPDISISADGSTIDVAGMKWNTVTDCLGFKIGKLNFAKRYRGKKSTDPECYEIPKKLTRRIITCKVCEIWDLVGLLVPIVARFKIDLHDLVTRKLQWDDEIPEELRKLWVENFDLMSKLGDIQFSRATVPSDAVSLEMETIEAGDASSQMICTAVYVRFMRKNGTYSCELVLGKSKLVPSGMTIPRAELYAAEINSSLGQMAQRAFGSKIVGRYKITDSKVAYYWIHAWEKPLKIWAFNRVNEVLRWSDLDMWFLVAGSDMPCDIGTRRNATLQDVGIGSQWQQGQTWMSAKSSNFPIKTIAEVKLEAEERAAYEKELITQAKSFVVTSVKSVGEQIADRLHYSQYIVHPNKYRFKSAVRILGIVFKFIIKASRGLKRKLFLLEEKENVEHRFKHFHCKTSEDVGMSGLLYEKIQVVNVIKAYKNKPGNNKLPFVVLSSQAIHLSLKYFYQKASKEVQKFASHTKAYKQSVVANDIRFWTGRLLPSQKFSVQELQPMSSAMLDLSSTKFCVPLVEKYSPVAWSMMYEIHWHHRLGRHSGVATTTRIIREYAYIIGVKEIAEAFRQTCSRCRWIAKRTVEVEFGPLSDKQLKLAPAFYITQVDLFGPFKAYQINVRASLKVWFAVFVCVVTSTVNIQVMESYSSGSFIAAFIRFASHNGYPKMILPDQGNNIESALKNVEIDWSDIKGRLHHSYGIEVETCGVGGHHQHGKVERKIRHIKETFMKSFHNERLSVLQWQTVADETTNSINNLPIGTGSSRNINMELDDLDIITPNRLRFGRNNERAPLGPAYLSNDPFKFMDLNQKIFDAW